jgi:copper chaperone NosL
VKKLIAIMMTFFLLIIISACGDKAVENKNEQAEGMTVSTEENHDESDHAAGPHEPGKEEVCAFCNMKVYSKADPMGVFTAQAKTKDGEYVFFDDSGCLLNYQRRDEVEYEEKWVRDYVTSEWIAADSAVPVKAEIKTPMKYGYAFFKDKESAENFISDNGEKNPELAEWPQINQISNERYMKKMKMNGSSMDKKEDGNMNEDDKKESGH